MSSAMTLLSVVPIRISPSEQSEMVSQLLFGETCNILAIQDEWLKIKTTYDNYTGWIDRKMVKNIDLEMLQNSNSYIVSQPILIVIEEKTRIKQWLAGGSVLYNPTDDFTSFSIMNNRYLFFELNQSTKGISLREGIVHASKQYINSPYLWGGKTPFGIDCSALTQIAYKINGLTLPRDSIDQYRSIDNEISLCDVLPGDLAFFSKNGDEVTHVGIVSDKNQIIHASGHVRFDILDSEGIYNVDLKRHTHRLISIKKCPDFIFL